MSGLKISQHKPLKGLEGSVRRILITEGYSKETLPIAPTGYGYLTYSRYPFVIRYKTRSHDNKDRLYITGQLQNELPFLELKGDVFHIGLELQPTASYEHFQIPGENLVDDIYSLRGNPVLYNKYITKLDEASSAKEVARVLQNILIDSSGTNSIPKEIDFAVKKISRTNGNLNLNDLIIALKISERQFRRKFKYLVGISPKKYCKVIQFNSAFEAIQTNQKERIYDLALQNGYYDHSHFINDFKTYLGKSPQQFLKSDHYFLKEYLGSKSTRFNNQ